MLSFSDLSMRYGSKILFSGVSMQFSRGNHYGLIGANGSGKSTLLNLVVGDGIPDKGEIVRPPISQVGFLKQEHTCYESTHVLDVVIQGNLILWQALEDKKALLSKEHFSEEECQFLERLELILQQQNGYSAESEAAKLLEGLGIPMQAHDRPLRLLSGGYRLRVLLAQVLFSRPELLILDEPTNHLDIASIRWLEGYLRAFPGTILVTSHDRDFLNAVCTHIVDVDYGTLTCYPGNYDAFLTQKEGDLAWKAHYLEKQSRRKETLQEFVDRFGAKATKAKQARSKERRIEKIEAEMTQQAILPSSRRYPAFYFQQERPSGVRAVTLKDIHKSFGTKKVLNKVSFEVERGEKIALIGPNGIGKSTLLEILVGRQAPDFGEIIWGHAATWAYFPQDHVREVEGHQTLLDWLSQFDRDATQEFLRGILGSVLFTGDTVHQSISTLSGGETARLLVAKMMLLRPNILLFDEPTNHLDMEATEELIRAIEVYPGTVLLVSHNRYFVQKTANRVLALKPDGIVSFLGTYEEYLAQQEPDYLVAHRTKERKIETSSQVDYEAKKRLKSERNAVQKKIVLLEKEAASIEKEIGHVLECMADLGFYQRYSVNEQKEKVTEKERLEQRLSSVMQEWEDLYLFLQEEG